MVTVIKPAEGFVLYGADCLDVLRFMPDNSVDSIVTDPPAGIAFMGKDWDKDKGGRDAWIAWMQEIAEQCLRVVKPGGHALVWAMPRTSHWTGMAWENAGWEPRDKIVHLFGTGFPKSLSVGKAIDKAAGAKREVIGYSRGVAVEDNQGYGGIARGGVGIVQKAVDVPVTASATAEAKEWEGWGTALKPASEDWWLLRKPLAGTVAATVLKHGTGALNIDACRVGTDDTRSVASATALGQGSGWNKHNNKPVLAGSECGRWPANCTHDGSDEVLAVFPDTGKSTGGGGNKAPGKNGIYGTFNGHEYGKVLGFGDNGSASRFFYCAKANTADRDEGLEHLTEAQAAGFPLRSADGERGGEGLDGTSTDRLTKRRNIHPTVKSTELMRYLTRLITPVGGLCLDPFMGSGSTGKACALEGFRFIGIEQEPTYLPVAEARIKYALGKAK